MGHFLVNSNLERENIAAASLPIHRQPLLFAYFRSIAFSLALECSQSSYSLSVTRVPKGQPEYSQIRCGNAGNQWHVYIHVDSSIRAANPHGNWQDHAAEAPPVSLHCVSYPQLGERYTQCAHLAALRLNDPRITPRKAFVLVCATAANRFAWTFTIDMTDGHSVIAPETLFNTYDLLTRVNIKPKQI